MSRQIPIALQSNLDNPVQYLTRVYRLRLKNGSVLGFAMWWQDIVYDHDDGLGPTTYSASQGIDPSTIESDVNFSVANAEGRILTRTNLTGLTIEMVEAGALDDAEWDCFVLDWRNPQPGTAVLLDAGDIGEVRTEDGLVIIPELVSYAMRLRQVVGHVWQRPGRCIFGTPADSQTGCGVDADALWEAGQVQLVGAESDRTFTGDIDAFFPGRVRFTSGQNASDRLYAVESVDGNTITLAETTPFPIAPGDEYEHRPDCTKLKDGPFGCDHWGNWPNFKGEWTIPSGDGVAGSVPGGNLPGGGGWAAPVPLAESLE
jgi:uncharacterized phage protein (TIGR02218 family)